MNSTVYQEKSTKKFTKTFDMSDYQILTDSGFIDLVSLHETIPYNVWEMKLSNGYELECANDHIIFDDNMNEVFVKNLEIGDRVLTDNGTAIVIEINETDRVENMYDFELVDDSNRRYYTNGILSHNTELAKQIARYLFDSDDALLRLDMSEFMEKISITRIQGSSPGYVGYEDANFLDRVRRKPYSVILLDEIEKAHDDIFNLFLQVLDDGHMTDSHGRKVNFKNCVLLMTSNVGTKMIKDFGSGIGFSKKEVEVDFKSTLEKELKKKFAPEFINRLDDIIYFRDLNKEDILKIVTLELNKSLSRAKQLEFDAEVDESLMEHLSIVGYDPQYGARPLKRAIQIYVDDPITDYIILNNPAKGTKLSLSWNKEKEDVEVKGTLNKGNECATDVKSSVKERKKKNS